MDSNDLTKERILNEAEKLFAQKGYEGVSVREITKAAGCNLASVNYHFGNKRNLYFEIFNQKWLPRAKRVHSNLDRLLSDKTSPTPPEIINALAKAFIEGALSEEGERHRHALLTIRELMQPSEAFEIIATEAIGPLINDVASRLKPYLPEDITEKELFLDVLSIFGMIIYFNISRSVVTHITGHTYDPEFKSTLIEHISRFAIEGLKGSIRMKL